MCVLERVCMRVCACMREHEWVHMRERVCAPMRVQERVYVCVSVKPFVCVCVMCASGCVPVFCVLS